MVAQVSAHSWRTGRRNRLLLPFLGLALVLAGPTTSTAAPLRGSVSVETTDGYARLVFVLSEDVDASARIAGNVLILTFAKPVAVSVDSLPAQAPSYISEARRDPDGRAVRFALSRKVTVNSMAAADKLFVDLLPDTWRGPPPGLPQDVVEELARLARDAERLEHLAHQKEKQKKLVPVLVHVASLPTFTRYVFDVPDQISVSADRAKERLTLTFDAPIPFDLSDAEAALPAAITSIKAEVESDSTLVRFSFVNAVDVRTFRDGKGYVVDILKGDAAAATHEKAAAGGSPPAVLEAGPSVKAAAMETGKPNWAPPAIAAQVPPAAAEPMAPAARVQPTAPDPTAPVARVQPTAPETAIGNRPAHRRSPRQRNSRRKRRLQQREFSQHRRKRRLRRRKSGQHRRSGRSSGAEVSAAQRRRSAAAMARVTQAAPQPAAPAAPVTPTAPESAAPEARVEPSPPKMPKASEARRLQSASAAAAARPAAIVAPMHALGAESPTEPAKSGSPEGAPPRRSKPGDTVAVEVSHAGANLKLSFPFATPTAAAVFHRADTLWIVFDSKSAIDLTALDGEPSRTVRGAEFVREGGAGVVRLRLDHPHLSSVVTEGQGWTVTIGDNVADPTRALDITRNLIGPNRASVTIIFDEPHQLHRIRDPEAGDDLLVVTGFAPARGFINEQDFVEFRALASTQGVVIEPLADDISVDFAHDKIVVGRPHGLTLSSSLQSVLHGSALRPLTFDAQVWGLDRESNYSDRQSQLLAAAASAPPGKRLAQRLDLARFYIARDMYQEAKGVLDVALSGDRPASEDVTASVLRAASEVMMRRPDDTLKDLSAPAIGDQHDAPLWRALAYACQGKWGLARDSFKRVEASIATLPIELQRDALKSAMRADIEVGDFAGAATELNDLETIGLPRELQPSISVLVGRLSEGMGRNEEALAAYRTAADSWDRPAAAEGRLRVTSLRYALGDLKRDEVISELETLTAIWRGDDTEIEALEMLARLYTEEGRYRDAFHVMRNAVAAKPDFDMTRRIQAEAAATFDSLFLAGKVDTFSAIDALALFYDFRELTPIGRRGDEMIRRLADRLVSVDLLDQAADLLQYQVDHRLQGAARAQVAARLAVVYLMDHKADRALQTLRSSRIGDLANELRIQRLLLEARALSDLGQYDLALEVVGNIEGKETIRLRSDILWAARRWAQSAEQIELYYGERWKDWQPLNEVERADMLRAAIGYALGDDALGLGRFREKYAAKMAQTPDAHDFEVVSAPLGTDGTEFRDIARAAAATDTLDSFLRDMQVRFQDASAAAPSAPSPPATPPPPKGRGAPVSSTAPATTPAALRPSSSARAAGKTAQR